MLFGRIEFAIPENQKNWNQIWLFHYIDTRNKVVKPTVKSVNHDVPCHSELVHNDLTKASVFFQKMKENLTENCPNAAEPVRKVLQI